VPLRYYVRVTRFLSHAMLLLSVLTLCSGVTLAQKQTRKHSSQPKPSPVVIEMPPAYEVLMKKASQAMLVVTAGWNEVDGTLQRFEKTNDGQWHSLGEKVPIVVGKNGLAWDGGIDPLPGAFPAQKHEGDGRSPAGIFTVGDTFGFAPSAPDLKLPYRTLTESIECVDDPSSSSYNEVVDRQQLPNPDWNSSEKMRSIPVYEHGVVVNYNDQHLPGAGSCIFMHIWNGPAHGTAGCTAMDRNQVLEILGWLDPAKNPVLIQFPAPLYNEVKRTWNLP
jgi:zinc D-Ala-D-Ala dipeptidase